MQISEEKYALIRDGIPVTVQRPGGRTEEKRAAVIDFQNPDNKHFLAIKGPTNPLRVVFVCAMWLAGFDVKCLSCLYLDKPLKAHTLMQTIARANRMAEGKSNGLIVDYIGIVKALRKTLADYTANAGGQAGSDPTVDKKELIARILDTIFNSA